MATAKTAGAFAMGRSLAEKFLVPVDTHNLAYTVQVCGGVVEVTAI